MIILNSFILITERVCGDNNLKLYCKTHFNLFKFKLYQHVQTKLCKSIFFEISIPKFWQQFCSPCKLHPDM